MSELMRAADLVICRAGASTISELAALGPPPMDFVKLIHGMRMGGNCYFVFNSPMTAA